MSDPIERQDAIDAIFSEPLYEPGMKKRDAEEVILAVFEKIKSLTPAQQGRETGAWIAVDHFADGKPVYREWKCSKCGCVVEDEKPTWNFCPMCGADMRSEREMYCRKI